MRSFARWAVAIAVVTGSLLLPMGVFPTAAYAVTCDKINSDESPWNHDNTGVHGTTGTGYFHRENYVRTVTYSPWVDVTFNPSTLPDHGMAMAMFRPNGGSMINTTIRCVTTTGSSAPDYSGYYTVATQVYSGTQWVFATEQLAAGTNTSYYGTLNY